jgi:uncharacterized membrane-anchored protein
LTKVSGELTVFIFRVITGKTAIFTAFRQNRTGLHLVVVVDFHFDDEDDA